LSLEDEILSLFAARRGHFRFESGHHGNLWLEIPRAYVHPERLRPYASRLARLLDAHEVKVVCGPLVEGALLAQMVAEELHSEFCFAEQFSQNRDDGLFPVGYRIPRAFRVNLRGKRVAVVDDVINAGSATRGTIDDLSSCGGHLAAIGALMVLGGRADELAASANAPLECLSRLPDNPLWEPASCPLCASGIPLESE
jgi:orotate phosphoribosyltransferase